MVPFYFYEMATFDSLVTVIFCKMDKKSKGKKTPTGRQATRQASREKHEFNVEQIIEQRLTTEGIYYLIKWEGFDEVTWEPAENVTCPAVLRRFYREMP